MRFQDETALVTGAAQGIGLGIARRLAVEGAHVVIGDINHAAALQAAGAIIESGGSAEAILVDIGRVGDLRGVVDQLAGRLGHIDMLVNNAATIRIAPLLEMTEEQWDQVVDVTLKGAFFCLQHVARHMIARRQGRIVNIASVAAFVPQPTSAAYGASKLGLLSLTRSAASVLAPYGVRVNAVCPGFVATPMWSYIDEERARLTGSTPGEVFRQAIEFVPLGRAAEPEDIADAVAFLLSTEAAYITGQSLNVCGGWNMR